MGGGSVEEGKFGGGDWKSWSRRDAETLGEIGLEEALAHWEACSLTYFSQMDCI